MGFREEFRGTGKTYAQWSLENTTETGFRANSERLKSLQLAVKSSFDEGITRMVRSQENLADSLREELTYQADQICQEVQRSSVEVVEAVQQMADYLGAGLSEVRWAVERHTRVSEQTLRLLLSSLSDESRQYWEQGVTCYETREYELAKERLEKALEANRTNSFAYQYLGFIAVDEDNAEAAIRNFDLARKFSRNNYDRAIALSHLARSSHATGNLRNAVDLSKAAVDADPETSKFWYEHATYSASSGDVAAAIASSREAIERDWKYWGVIAKEPSLDCIRREINQLFEELRSRERHKAGESIEQLKKAIEKSRQLSVEAELAPCMEHLRNLEKKFNRDNVHLYREIQSESPQAAQRAFQFANEILAGKRRDLTSSLALLRENLRKLSEQSFAGFGFLCAMVAVCVAIVAGFATFFWLVCVPIGVWIMASKLKRQSAVFPLMSNIARVEESIQIVTDLQQEAQSAIRAGEVPIATQSSGPYSAVLTSAGSNKINVIKAIREITRLDLREAKSMVDGAPRPIATGISEREAERIQSVLSQAGATVQINRLEFL